jgi:hypothetical protein
MKVTDIIKEDDLDNLLQAKGLAPKPTPADPIEALAMQLQSALEQDDDIAKLATGKIDASTLHKQDRPGIDPRTTGPSATPQARATAVPTQHINSKALPPVAQLKPAPKPKVKINIPQPAGSVPWQSIAEHLKSKWNMSISQIAGMIANIAHESSFRPGVETIDSNGLPSGGLFQHNGPRFTQLKQKLGPNWKSNWQGQIDFALSEPDGANYRNKKFTDAPSASKAWTIGFERPAKAQIQAAKRAPSATHYASNINESNRLN